MRALFKSEGKGNSLVSGIQLRLSSFEDHWFLSVRLIYNYVYSMFSPCGYPMKTYAHRRRLKNMYNSIHTFLNRNDNLDAVVSVCIFLVKILFKKKTFFACILFIDF